MKIKTFTAAALLLGVLFLLPLTTEAYPNEKNGFRGWEWGTQFEAVKAQLEGYNNRPFTSDDREDGVVIGQYCYRIKENPMLGTARICSTFRTGNTYEVRYYFRLGQLTKVSIDFDLDYNGKNTEAALNALEENFGPGRVEIVPGYEGKIICYHWDGEMTTMEFWVNKPSFAGDSFVDHLYIKSTKLDSVLISEIQKKKDQETRKLNKNAEF